MWKVERKALVLTHVLTLCSLLLVFFVFLNIEKNVKNGGWFRSFEKKIPIQRIGSAVSHSEFNILKGLVLVMKEPAIEPRFYIRIFDLAMNYI
jgi:hypothetical protein